MIRPRDPARSRVDALRLGAEKLLAGCAACGDGYFVLARQHGATEGDIAKAISAAERQGGRDVFGRREFLAAATFGAVVVTGALAPRRESGAAQSVEGARVAWLWGLRPLAEVAIGQPSADLSTAGTATLSSPV